jgi:hypothetical protein
MTDQYAKIFRDNWVPYHLVNFQKLQLDETVKINNGYEKFWVKILFLETTDELILGKVSSKLVNDLPYNYQDYVLFHTSNIMEHHTKEDYEENIIKIQKQFNEYIDENYPNEDFTAITSEKEEQLKNEFYEKNIIIKN